MALESFKVRFEGDLELRVGFGGAAKLLETLKPDHILYRKLESPEELERMRDETPGELLRSIFDSYDGPLTGAQIKQVVVEEALSRLMAGPGHDGSVWRKGRVVVLMTR